MENARTASTLTAKQVPAEIVTVEALPRGAVLKVNAAEVRELIVEWRARKDAS